ncbi:MAG: serine hydrolase [Saprospiraceae bacterium]|nr:serine hydrolase [Saprospiraceae bacterium]
MNKWLFTLLVLGMLVSCDHATSLEDLRELIEKEFNAEEGTFALAFHNVSTGEELLINADESFHAASTMKTPVMIEVYKQAAEGLININDSIMVKNTFYSIVDSSTYELNSTDDSEKDLYNMVGQKRAISDLVYDMIIVSSNLATNLVIDLVDARKVTETMREIGAMDISVLRGVEDIKAFRQGLSNSTTAYDLMVIYKKMAKHAIVSPQASKEMIEILKDQKFNEIIPAHLPDDVIVAHKTGVITALHHDSGIVMLPDGHQYVLILLSKDLGDFDSGTERMAKVSKLVYDHTTN